MKRLGTAVCAAVIGSAATCSAQPLSGAVPGIDPATGRVAAPLRHVVVETVIEPGDATRKHYAAAHKHRHVNCNRGGWKRGDEVGCGGDDIDDGKVKSKDKEKNKDELD